MSIILSYEGIVHLKYISSMLCLSNLCIVFVSSGGTTFFAMVSRAAIMSASIATWVVTPESFPTELRTVAHCGLLSFSRIGAFLSPYLVFSSTSKAGIGLSLGALNIVGALFCFTLTENYGKIQEGILASDRYIFIIFFQNCFRS